MQVSIKKLFLFFKLDSSLPALVADISNPGDMGRSYNFYQASDFEKSLYMSMSTLDIMK